MPLFSIIVPVYNTEMYLPACINSVLSQQYSDFELLIIDDGSSASCANLCDTYPSHDTRVRTIHQENGGLSIARNTGLSYATGDYILFLDSDDIWLDETFLARLAERVVSATPPDVVLYNYVRMTEQADGAIVQGKPCVHFPQFSAENADETLRALVANNAWQSSAAIKAVRRDLIGSLRFTPGLLSEDIEWSATLLRTTAHVEWLDAPAYYGYLIRKGSITHSISLQNVEDLTGIVRRLWDAACEEDFPVARREAALGYAAFQYCTLLINMRLCQTPLPAVLRRQIDDMAPILQNNLTGTVRLVRRVYAVLGLRLTGWLLAVWFRMFGR